MQYVLFENFVSSNYSSAATPRRCPSQNEHDHCKETF